MYTVIPSKSILYRFLTRGLVLMSISSPLLGLFVFCINGKLGLLVDKTFREPLAICTFFLVLLTNIHNKHIKKKIVSFYLISFLFIVSFLFSQLKGVETALSAKSLRELFLINMFIPIGYFLICPKTFFRTTTVLSVICVLFLSMELMITPHKLWPAIKFTDFYLARQSLSEDVTGGAYKGYKSETTILGLYENYDSFDGKIRVNTRYGGLFGESVTFGHFFGSLTTIILVYGGLIKKRNMFSWLVRLMLIFGLFFIKTKGYLVTIFLYYLVLLYSKHRRFRIPIVFSAISSIVIYIVISAQHNLTAWGHISNLLMSLQVFIHAPLMGQGMGSTAGAFDDSFFAKILVEGGLFLVSSYILIGLWVLKSVSKIKNETIRVNLIAANAIAFIPPLLAGSATQYLSWFLSLLFIGVLVRIADEQKMLNDINNADVCISKY